MLLFIEKRINNPLNAFFTVKNLNLEYLLRSSRFANLLSFLGGLVYFLQMIFFIHTQASVLDEGAYLVEGYLFSIGRYIPFQDFGFRMNQLPMAYLIPGFIQRWFGPGIRVGRYFALILACLMLLALWITARRLGGVWLATGAVWVYALNPAPMKMYSQADTQGLAACILMGSMLFTLGEKRPPWQISLGSFLAGILILVRVDLLPVLPFLVLYILWQNGWKQALLSAISALFPVVGIHLLYWPNILRIWAYWLPASITPFLDPWRSGIPPILGAISGYLPRINSFTQALRFFFVTITGAWVTWIAWPRRSDWKSQAYFRIAVFLSALFIVLSLVHLWATVLINNCIFCLAGYLSFFAGLGVLLLVVSFSSWQRNISSTRQLLAYSATIALTAAWGYSVQLLNFVNKVTSGDLVKNLLTIKAPLLRGHHEIYIYIANKLDVSSASIFSFTSTVLRALLGALIGCILIGLVWIAARPLSGIRLLQPYPTGLRALVTLLVLGLILSPTNLFGGGYQDYDCGGDVIASMETVGIHLKQYIPPNALVNWDGPDSPVPLLYIPGVRIFPAQMTGAFEWREVGDLTTLSRYGLWNQAIAEQFFAQSDYEIAWQSYLANWQKEALKIPGKYEILPSSPPLYDCYPNLDTRLMIFKKKP
jgi:hypothetical protein